MGRSKAGKTFAQEAGFRGNGFKGYRGYQYTEGVRGRGKQYLPQKPTSERQFYKRGPPADRSWLHATLFILFVVIFVAWILGY